MLKYLFQNQLNLIFIKQLLIFEFGCVPGTYEKRLHAGKWTNCSVPYASRKSRKCIFRSVCVLTTVSTPSKARCLRCMAVQLSMPSRFWPNYSEEAIRKSTNPNSWNIYCAPEREIHSKSSVQVNRKATQKNQVRQEAKRKNAVVRKWTQTAVDWQKKKTKKKNVNLRSPTIATRSGAWRAEARRNDFVDTCVLSYWCYGSLLHFAPFLLLQVLSVNFNYFYLIISIVAIVILN